MTDTKALKKGKVVSGFLGEVLSELRQVSWPTRRDVLRMTGIVVAITVAVGLYLGGLDYLFTYLMGLLI